MASMLLPSGSIWRVDGDGTLRALARGLKFPSAAAPGRGDGGFGGCNL
jgi:hypothetical protein